MVTEGMGTLVRVYKAFFEAICKLNSSNQS